MTNASDLQPKPFTIKIKEGYEFECKPPRLSHAITISKVGFILSNPKDYSHEEIREAELEIDKILTELVPDLKGVQLGMNDTITAITEIMNGIEPSDNKELRKEKIDISGGEAKKEQGSGMP